MRDILDGLTPEQRTAAEAVSGPVCIVAGAGTGKTTTITRRIANQIAGGTHPADRILAVTFTDRAANELKQRLASLGVPAVRSATFHAEALRQVAFFTDAPKLMASKGEILAPLVRNLPKPYKFRPVRDIAGEIEFAKNRRVSPERYLDELGHHTPAIPHDLMVRVYANYEAAKRRKGVIDFEDLLESGIRLIEDSPDAAERIRARFQAITVDEYQDVNLLQATLLDRWVGDRNEVCVVGDDHQSIYGFTGASPEWLLGFGRKWRDAKIVKLTVSHRSQPRILELANRLSDRIGGYEKTLTTEIPAGPEPTISAFPDGHAEQDAVIRKMRKLNDSGVEWSQMAVLYRINARGEDWAERLTDEKIPYVMRDARFLDRPGPRSIMQRLRRADGSMPAWMAVDQAARSVGWDPESAPETEQEENRQADMTRLVRLAQQDELVALEPFLQDLRSKFAGDAASTGVTLSTIHRAKGLEWDAVFLPRVEDRELPYTVSGGTPDEAEERRLMYVAITRARQHLMVSWADERDGKRGRASRYISELVQMAIETPERPRPKRKPAEHLPVEDKFLFTKLKELRKQIAASEGVPAFVVFHDSTLREICASRPRNLDEMSDIAGVGPNKLARWGSDFVDVVREHAMS